MERLTGSGVAGETYYLQDHDTEYWKITTQDGTQYYFGRQGCPGVAEQDVTHSVFAVPVYETAAGARSCYNASWASSWCSAKA